MRYLLATLLTLTFCFNYAASQEVTIRGKREAKPGQLVRLVPENAEETRTIWNLNYPEEFEEFAEENGKLFIAMPKSRVSFSLLVIPNDVSQPIQNIRYTIHPSDIDVEEPEDPEEPEEPVEPDRPDVTSSPLYQATKDAYGLVTDPDKIKYGQRMSKAFGYISGQVKDKKFTSVEQMLEAVRKANNGTLDGFEEWPSDSRMHWLAFRTEIARQFDLMDSANQLGTVDDHWLHFKAIEIALEEVAK